jgi:RNA polymerase sigma-70 factor (ECF subfamily)
MEPPKVLLENCRLDNRKAHHELYVMCFSVLYAVCCRYYINRDDRMAALNMIFFKIIRNVDKYLKKERALAFEAWIKRIAINYIIDEFRKEKRYSETIELNDTTPEEIHPTIDDVILNENKEALLRIIDLLPSMSRTVFNLYFVDGYKHEEIAMMLGISSNTSKVHLFNARKKLQELIASANSNQLRTKTAM